MWPRATYHHVDLRTLRNYVYSPSMRACVVPSWLETLARSHRPALVARLRTWLGCAAAAEDAVQDAFLRLAGSAALDAPDDPGAYFVQTARNAAIDRLRVVGQQSSAAATLSQDLACATPDPEQVAGHRARVRRFATALASLPPRQRAIVVAARLDGRPYAAIAAEHGISVDAVTKSVARALSRLAAATDP